LVVSGFNAILLSKSKAMITQEGEFIIQTICRRTYMGDYGRPGIGRAGCHFGPVFNDWNLVLLAGACTQEPVLV